MTDTVPAPDSYLLFSKRERVILPVGNQESDTDEAKDGCPAGYARPNGPEDAGRARTATRLRIARRIEQISGDLLAVNQGTLYPVLLKLEQEGAIASEWGASENNRRARFYRLTRAGHRLLEAETRDWERTATIIGRFFEVKAEDLS